MEKDLDKGMKDSLHIAICMLNISNMGSEMYDLVKKVGPDLNEKK